MLKLLLVAICISQAYSSPVLPLGDHGGRFVGNAIVIEKEKLDSGDIRLYLLTVRHIVDFITGIGSELTVNRASEDGTTKDYKCKVEWTAPLMDLAILSVDVESGKYEVAKLPRKVRLPKLGTKLKHYFYHPMTPGESLDIVRMVSGVRKVGILSHPVVPGMSGSGVFKYRKCFKHKLFAMVTSMLPSREPRFAIVIFVDRSVLKHIGEKDDD